MGPGADSSHCTRSHNEEAKSLFKNSMLISSEGELNDCLVK